MVNLFGEKSGFIFVGEKIKNNFMPVYVQKTWNFTPRTFGLNERNTTVSGILSDGAFTKPGEVHSSVGWHTTSEVRVIRKLAIKCTWKSPDSPTCVTMTYHGFCVLWSALGLLLFDFCKFKVKGIFGNWPNNAHGNVSWKRIKPLKLVFLGSVNKYSAYICLKEFIKFHFVCD